MAEERMAVDWLRRLAGNPCGTNIKTLILNKKPTAFLPSARLQADGEQKLKKDLRPKAP